MLDVQMRLQKCLSDINLRASTETIDLEEEQMLLSAED